MLASLKDYLQQISSLEGTEPVRLDSSLIQEVKTAALAAKEELKSKAQSTSRSATSAYEVQPCNKDSRT